MADDADMADNQQQRILDALLSGRKLPKFTIHNESGECIQCGNKVDPIFINGQDILSRWCSDECRAEYD